MRLGYSLVLCFAVLSFIVYLKGKKKDSLDQDAFWEREAKANSVRKKPLTDLDYITIPMDSLPLQKNTTDEQLLEYQDTISTLSDRTIVNLTGISNTDLKFQYGAPNLTVLTEYDQNFIVLARTLNNWAHRLYELGMTEEAKTVLEFGVTCKTDVKAHYILLATIYLEEFHPDRINTLIDTANSLNSLMKDPIVTALAKIRDDALQANL